MAVPDGLGRRVATGATWVVAQRLAVRAIGLASTMVLARLLAPADFGLIALATTLAGLLDALAELGFDLALIQKRTATRADYDTAWTLTVARGVLVAFVLLLLAGPIAAAYGDDRLVALLALLALGSALAGLQNIGIVEFRRELRFDREFAMLVWTKLGGFVVTLAAAWWWRDHRALVAGILAGKLLGLVLSYVMHPYRPRPCVAGALGYLHFSKWLVANNVLGAVRARIDTFVVGKLAGGEALGIYSVAYEISSLALTELIMPISRAVHPGFAQIAGDKARLARGYLDVFAIIMLLATPLAIGIALTAEHVVRIFLGAKWLATVPLIQVLTLYGLINLPSANTGALYLAIGRPDLIALRGIPPLAALIPALLYATGAYGAQGAAWSLVLAAIVGFAVNIAVLRREIGVGPMALLRHVVRPAIAATAMGLAVAALDRAWPVAPDLPALLAQLAALAALGAVVYVAVALALWRLADRPYGAESNTLDAVNAWRSSRRGGAS